ncbi:MULTISPECIES: AAA family ATPase [Enterobacteriaceae]|uniref:AAA family ATPase n=1 Tax=Enterobacteriaceae TaxID=543 RepID=UPI0015A7465C|nr:MULTISPECIES: AAA family ATPase [Enterobacteriaceae]MDM2901047.1 AAA family ATPase [Citrobacter sp. Cpo037]
MKLELSINQIQHLSNLNASFDFSESKIFCIVSHNGIGKTTLIKSMGILFQPTIFVKTSNRFIFNPNSELSIDIDGDHYEYKYNPAINQIDCKNIVNQKNLGVVELPVPYGKRYGSYSRLNEIDGELRIKIAYSEYSTPEALIQFLTFIYPYKDFSDLKSVEINGEEYYFRLVGNSNYIREDYFSSGEYFVINIFRIINSDTKLIIIDEIDMSLDSYAQIRLVKLIKKSSEENEKFFIFTTHSLAMLKSIDDIGIDIYYLENSNGNIDLKKRGYSYIKGVMFEFKGSDKYILTEDSVLKEYIKMKMQKIIKESTLNKKEKIEVISIGGCENVIDFYKRNKEESFLCERDEKVLVILDGDVREEILGKNKSIASKLLFLPFDSIEKEIFKKSNNTQYNLPYVGKLKGKPEKRNKKYFDKLTKRNGFDMEKIFDIAEKDNQEAVLNFENRLSSFLKM